MFNTRPANFTIRSLLSCGVAVVFRRRLACVLAIGFASAASAAAGPLHDPDAAGVIEEIQRFYRDNPICENVLVSVRTPTAGPTPKLTRATYRLRYDMGKADIVASAPIATLELGSLILQAEMGKALLAHARDPGSYVERSLSAGLRTQSLAEVIPPTPIPQLDLALINTADAASTVCDQFWPYASGITWRRTETDARTPTRRIVRGDFDGGTIVVHLTSARLRMIEIGRPTDRVSITMSFNAASPCDPRRKLIDPERRTRVASIGDLHPRGAPMVVNEALPEMGLSLASGELWNLSDLLEPPPEAVIVGMPAAEHAILLISRVAPEDGQSLALRINFAELGRLLRQSRTEAFQPRSKLSGEPMDAAPRFGYARVLAFNNHSPEVVIKQLDSAAQVWGGRNVLWANSVEKSIDLIAPTADACAVIVDSKAVVRAVVSIDASASAESLRDQLLLALFELGAPRGMAPFVPSSQQTPPGVGGANNP